MPIDIEIDHDRWLDGDFASLADPYSPSVRSGGEMSSGPKPVLTPRIAHLQAHKARRLASALLSPGDRERLLSYTREMDDRAAQLEATDPAAARLSESS